MSVIRFENISKRYVVYHARTRSMQDLFVRKFSRTRDRARETAAGEFWALREVSFDISAGEMVGVIGPNGAGKSTVLKLLARIIEPTRGKVHLRGRLNALIELGAGFHEELTGRENIYLSGALLGLSRQEIRRQLDEIVAFSELEKFIDMPVKHYSSGMHMRLGFAIATVIEAEILLVDEVLAVGDANFQRKCFERIAEIREKGTTILLVSHQMADIERHCDRAILIMGGKIIADGAPTDAAQRYKDLAKRRPADIPDFYNVEYIAFQTPEQMRVGERALYSVTIRNNSHQVWNGEQGSGTRMVSVGYHWLDRYGNIYQFMGPRKILPHNLGPGESVTVQSFILPPQQPGNYLLELDIAAEGAGWFGAHGEAGPQIAVSVLPEQNARHNGDLNSEELAVAHCADRTTIQ